jgi:hypothetical protein
MPGLGIILGAEFMAAAGGDMSVFGSADRLAGFGGVAPKPAYTSPPDLHLSRCTLLSGNLRRPQRYSRRLQRVFYTSALFGIRHCEESRRFYDRKRAEGKRHTQAVLALARRRVNVLWAVVRYPASTQAFVMCGWAAVMRESRVTPAAVSETPAAVMSTASRGRGCRTRGGAWAR